MIKAVIFDWGRTLHDPTAGALFPEATPVIAHVARSYRLAIVSLVTRDDYTAQVARRGDLLRDAGLATSFAAVLFAPNDKDGLYERALAELDLRATDVALVDDRMEAGIRWGNHRGAMTIWLRRGKFAHERPTSETGLPTYTIDTLAALERLLPL